MPSTLDSCEKYFGTRDIYALLELTKDSLERDIKKAYYKLSLKVHPDRVPEEEKEIATEKFKVLARIHQVLTDKNKKALYDEKQIIDDEDDEGKLSSWLELWQKIFKPISVEDIDNYQREYVGSELERTDVKKAYVNGRGCINYMMNCVPFMSVEDEPRIQEIIKKMIDSGEVPEYKIFTNEPKDKRTRRHKKYAREKLEADAVKQKMAKNKSSTDSLEQQIIKRQQERASEMGSWFAKFMDKYDKDEDDSEEFTIEHHVKRSGKKKSGSKKQQPTENIENRKVRSGRVSKKK